MSKLIVVTAPNSSYSEERDAVEKELQKRVGPNDIVVVLLDGWRVCEFNIAEAHSMTGRHVAEYKTIASTLDDEKKRRETIMREAKEFQKIRDIVTGAIDDAVKTSGSLT